MLPIEETQEDNVEQVQEGALVQEEAFSDEDVKNALFDLLKNARDEDREYRDENIRLWKRLEFYWNNILDIFLDPISRDWRVPNWDELEEDGEVAPRLINIYRPHGEAIVAALSVTVPATNFIPDNAERPEDIEFASACRDIAGLLSLHNEDELLFIKSLVVMLNQGTIFGYNYYNEDVKFGTIQTPKIESKDIRTYDASCPQCGEEIDAGMGQVPQELTQPYQCPTCGYQGLPQVTSGIEKLPQIVGYTDHPKGSVTKEIFSGLNVKVPAYVKKQEECGYLLLEFYQSVAMLRSIFQEDAEKINSKRDHSYESFYRLPPQYFGNTPENACNVSCLWLRPWQFWILDVSKKDLILHLTQKFPDGLYAIFVNDELMDVYAEKMDEHWTISKNVLGNFIYAKPLGENLATVQDIRAELVEIEIQTAEHGIPETFADPKVLDFQKYGEGRSKPGMVTPAKPRPGKSIGDGFFTSKPAILSQEISPLKQSIDQDAQFVLGSFPSVYGGPSTGGSKTASEYSQSRAQALQRLGTTWKIASHFWSQLTGRAVIEYANVLRELDRDESYSKKEGNSFINVTINSQSLSGKIGRIEPEASEQLPSSWAQKKDAIQQLLLSGIPEILMTLTHPNNAEIMKSAVGLNELYIPGEEDRNRQLKEFALLSQGMQVPANPEYDNEEIHIEVLKSLLEGPLGDSLDQNGKNACLMHLQMHEQSMASKAAMQAQQEQASQGSAPANKPKEGQDAGR